MGIAIQDDDIASMAKEGYLFLILYTATGGRGHRVRIRIRDKHVNDHGAAAA